MRKTKLEKGITLVALIITIVVLLILAVASIGAVRNSGIIGHAQETANKNTVAQEKEHITLALNEWQLQKNTPNNTTSFKAVIETALQNEEVTIEGEENGPLTVTFTKTKNKYKITNEGIISEIGSDPSDTTNSGDDTVMPVATVGTVVSENSTINGEAYSSSNPVIPAGFKAVNVTTEGHESSWDAEGGPQVIEGLVISDGTSEFVWIPVETLNNFARPTSGTDANNNTNYQGVLYNFSGTTATEISNYGQTTTNNREPSNLSASYDSTSKMSIWTENLYQESFNKMVKSVAEYGGFYVGRYETSMSGSTAKSKSEETPMKSVDWYTAYTNSLTYSTSGVISEMIWGCQWDAMLKFILTGSEASHVTASNNVRHDLSSTYKTGGTNYSGKYNDIASNIYDLEGNVREWTQKALNTYDRVLCGGNYLNSGYSPSSCKNQVPSSTGSVFGSRLTLYVEL